MHARKSGSPVAAETIGAARRARTIKRYDANRTIRDAILSAQDDGAGTLREIGPP